MTKKQVFRMLPILIIVLFEPIIAQDNEYIITEFDSNEPGYWQYFTTSSNPPDNFIHMSISNDTSVSGSGSMRTDWSVTDSESWGGFVQLRHFHPDGASVYDLTNYNTLSLWYFNSIPASLPNTCHIKIDLLDVSDSPNGNNTYNLTESEIYFSFNYILDNQPGWNQLRIPLIADTSYWHGEGFNLTGWDGIPGNHVLDKNKIKGIIIDFSIAEIGDGDISIGQIYFDRLSAIYDSSLPVEILSFEGRKEDMAVLLEWETATEVNNKGFEIERSLILSGAKNLNSPNGWETIAFVAGNGSTTENNEYSFTDKVTNLGSTKISYRLKQIDFDGTYSYSNEIEIEILPKQYKLEQNYPNPFNPVTKIKYSLPLESEVKINIYNTLGEKVAEIINKIQPAGYYEMEWNANNYSSGVYIYRIEAKAQNAEEMFRDVKKMILLR